MKVHRRPLKSKLVPAFIAALLLSGAAYAATTEKIVQSFMGSDGNYPLHCGLLLRGGKLFGTTISGGIYNQGVVFELSPSSSGWTETVLYNFTGGSDGGNPIGTLVADKAGNLYGTTTIGGDVGIGTVFELVSSGSSWTESVLYSFENSGNGAIPFGGVVFDKAGNLYGTTEAGGVAHCPPTLESCGVVYELSPANGRWTEKVLYRFTGHADGALPLAPVALDSAGNVYGTTEYGGAGVGFGVVFELTNTNGSWTENVIHSFTDTKTDGAFPLGALVLDQAGNLYSTTAEGGATFNGTVFELSPGTSGWSQTLLYSFQGGTDGIFPEGRLTLDGNGNVYGTASEGGIGNCPGGITGTCGTVFELTPSNGSWKENELYEFHGTSDGGLPQGGLILDKTGDLFGIAADGGPANDGVVFEVKH